jgi:cytochrome c553
MMGAARAPLHEDDYQEIAEFASAMEMKYKTFDASARGDVVCTILNTL